jgi:hypothetical protein
MPDWIYCATGQQVDAASTASLLATHQAIWCSPPGLRPNGPGVPAPNDRVWLVWRDGGSPVLLGGGRALAAPRQLYNTATLWVDPDMPGIRAAAVGLGYGGGPAMSFLRLGHPHVLQPGEFPVIPTLGSLAGGPNPATDSQLAALNATLLIV